MSTNISTLLLEDSRFTKRGTEFLTVCSSINEYINQDPLKSELESNFNAQKNLVHLLNLLQYALDLKDSFATSIFTKDSLLKIIKNGLKGNINYTIISDIDLKDKLKDRYIDYKKVLFELDSSDSIKSNRTLNFLKSKTNSKKNIEKYNGDRKLLFDEEYWSRSIDLNWPSFPLLDDSNILLSLKRNGEEYNIPSDKILPFDQSQITCVTDYHRFSDEAILNLFPPMRIYTRDSKMYQSYLNYSNLEYDEDLGIIFPISNYTVDQIKKNIIEYPHFNVPDRIVTDKKLDKEVLRDFWKDIEIDGEIFPTHKVWDELEDTKHLPKHPVFMNEYVVRRYILDRTIGKVKHKYHMRGDIRPFLTLYNTPDYYKDLGYDPIQIGKQCIKSRQAYKFSCNPIVRLMLNEGMNLEQLKRLSI